jgi:bifunctional DNase/RNase
MLGTPNEFVTPILRSDDLDASIPRAQKMPVREVAIQQPVRYSGPEMWSAPGWWSRPVTVAVVLLLSDAAPRARAGAGPAIQEDAAKDLVTVELSTVGFDRTAGAPIVLLRDPESGSILPIWVGMAEAQAIAMALHGIVPPRPMTHDLMAALLTELGAKVEEVVVHDLRDRTYFGLVRLRVAGENTARSVDSRPSDALALALRTGAPIRVARKILVEAPQFDFVAPDGPSQIVQAMGITVVARSPALQKEFDLPDRPGVVVTHVVGRARDEGLERGDLILEVNGEPLQAPIDFFRAVRDTPRGSRVRITYWRKGEEHELELPRELPPERTTPLVA